MDCARRCSRRSTSRVQGSIRDQSRSCRSTARRTRRKRASRRGRRVRRDGKPVLEIGDVAQPVFPRSAVKAIQALPLVESGAADALRLRRQGTGAGLRLAPRRAGACRACARRCWRGRDWTRRRSNAARTGRATRMRPIALARAGRTPSALHNNCSGKHSGFLCTCRHLNLNHRGYVGCRPSAPGDDPRGDGGRDRRSTSMPATADRRLLDPDLCGAAEEPRHRLCEDGDGRRAFRRTRAKAAKRLFAACMAEPFFMSLGCGRPIPLDAGRARPHFREDRRGRRLLRRRAGTRARHRAEMRRRRRPRRRSDDRGRAGKAAAIGRGARRQSFRNWRGRL